MRVREIGLRLLQRCGSVYVVFLSVKQPDTESDMWLSSYLMPTNSNIEARAPGPYCAVEVFRNHNPSF